MNKQASDKQTIIKYAKELLIKNGEKGLSMRSLSAKAGISLGTVYNYFPNKDAIIGALMEDFWKNIFFTNVCSENLSSSEILKRSFDILHENYSSFTSLFSLSKNVQLPERMFESTYITHFIQKLSQVMEKEDSRHLVFSSSFTSLRYAKFLFTSLLQGLLQGQQESSFLLAVHQKIMKGNDL